MPLLSYRTRVSNRDIDSIQDEATSMFDDFLCPICLECRDLAGRSILLIRRNSDPEIMIAPEEFVIRYVMRTITREGKADQPVKDIQGAGPQIEHFIHET